MIKKAHEEFGKRSISVYLISMTKSVSDLLEVLVLAKEAGINRLHADGTMESHLNVAPLLETIDDLTAGPKIMEELVPNACLPQSFKKYGRPAGNYAWLLRWKQRWRYINGKLEAV